MKRLITSIAFVLLLFTYNNLWAQDATATVNSSANVVAGLNATTEDNVFFGTVASDLTPTPTLTISDGSESGTTNQGVFGIVHLNGEANQDVAISWNGQSNTLTLGDGGGNTMDWSITAGVVDGNILQGSFTGVTTDITANNNGTQNATLDGSGQKSVVFGGTLGNATPSPLPSGTYSANFTVQIDYTFGS